MTNIPSKTPDGNSHHSSFDKIRANANTSHQTIHNSMDPSFSSSSSSSPFITPSNDGYATSDDSWSLVSQDGDGVNFNDIVSTDGSVGDEDPNENLEDIITRGSSALSNHNNKKNSLPINPFSPLDFEDPEDDDNEEDMMRNSSNYRITRLSISTLNDLNPECSASFSIPKIIPPTSSDSSENLKDPKGESCSIKKPTESRKQKRRQLGISNDFKQAAPIGLKSFLYGALTVFLGIFVTVVYNQINESLIINSINDKTISLNDIPKSHIPIYLEVCAKAEKDLLDNAESCFITGEDDLKCFDAFNRGFEKDKDFCKFSNTKMFIKVNSIYIKANSKTPIELANEGMNKLNSYYEQNRFVFFEVGEFFIRKVKSNFKLLKPKVESNYKLWKPRISKLGKISIEKCSDGYNWVAPRVIDMNYKTYHYVEAGYRQLEPKFIDLKDQSIEQTKQGLSWLKPKIYKLETQFESMIKEQSKKLFGAITHLNINFWKVSVQTVEDDLRNLQDFAKIRWAKFSNYSFQSFKKYDSWVKHCFESIIRDSNRSIVFLRNVLQGRN